jgi:hypothetical protein
MRKPTTEEMTVDFGAGQSSLEELSGGAPIFLNMLSDAGNAVRMRPGLRPWADFDATPTSQASPIIGMFNWRTFLVFVCEDRTIWAWYGQGDVRPLSDSTDVTTLLDGSLRPVFAYDYQRVVITGGGAPQKWEGAGLSARLGGSPPVSTHIAYADQRLVVNLYDNTGVIQWSPPGVGNHETWTTAGVGSGGFAEAEAAPDPVLALAVNSNEVFVFGTQTVQVFTPDDLNGFVVATTLAIGNGARFSVIDTDSTYTWLDERHRFVQSSGRDFKVISSPGMAKAVAALATVTDCWSFRARIGSFDLLAWVFPTAGRLLVFDQVSQKWGEWKSWTGSEYSGWIGNSYYFWADRNVHLVGLADGTIAEMTFDAYKDMTLNIKAISRTGFVDAGTGARKLCQRLQLQMKRGPANDNGVTPTAEVRYRNDLGAFGLPVEYPLGDDYEPTINKYGLGMYRQRQYELAYENNNEFVLTGARETLELGDS